MVQIDVERLKKDPRLCLAVFLEKTLGRALVLPARKINSIDEFLKAFPAVKDVFVDGTERPIQKAKNHKRRNKSYSGKKILRIVH